MYVLYCNGIYRVVLYNVRVLCVCFRLKHVIVISASQGIQNKQYLYFLLFSFILRS